MQVWDEFFLQTLHWLKNRCWKYWKYQITAADEVILVLSLIALCCGHFKLLDSAYFTTKYKAKFDNPRENKQAVQKSGLKCVDQKISC